MFCIHFFDEEQPKIGEMVLVQIDNDETRQATLGRREEDGMLYWKIFDTDMTIAVEGNEKWVDIEELWESEDLLASEESRIKRC
jgi:hypothetical protein